MVWSGGGTNNQAAAVGHREKGDSLVGLGAGRRAARTRSRAGPREVWASLAQV